MRYAVFSDVHSNLEAFEAVLDEFKKCRIDRYLFLGDIVGYGASPQECITALKLTEAVSVVGNHDGAVLGSIDTKDFNEVAQEAVLWTKENIRESDKQFLSNLPLVQSEKKICLVHGTLSRPQDFDYMIDGYQAMKSFYALEVQICFIGHTHIPGIFVEEQGKILYTRDAVIPVRNNKRYIVNAGSIGQPRDGDSRACFCIYDDAASRIEFKRIPYDIESAQRKILAAGLPKGLAHRLAVGR